MPESMSPKNSKMFSILRYSTLLLFGGVIGGGITMLAILSGPNFYEKISTVGLFVGAVLFTLSALFIILRNVLRTQFDENKIETFNKKYLFPFVEEVLIRRTGDDELVSKWSDNLSHFIKTLFGRVVFIWSSWVGASIALAAAVALASAVVSLATVVIGQRQIERLDSQNNLIEQQIYEATAARISSVFSAQLPSLLEAIEKSRPKDNGAEWQVGPDLVARVQAIIDLAEPYAPDPEMRSWDTEILNIRNMPDEINLEMANQKLVETKQMLFSPERAQLFILLLSTKFPFEQLPVPLDFSQSDFTNLRVNRNISFGPNQLADVGETIFSDSNFRNSYIENVDFSRADLSGAVFTDYGGPIKSNKYIALPSERRNDVRNLDWLGGANLEGVIVEVNHIASEAELNDPRSDINKRVFGKLINAHASVTLDQLWGVARFKQGKVYVYPEQYLIASQIVSDLVKDIGDKYGLELPVNMCNKDELASLGAAIYAVNNLDQTYADYIKIMLTDLDMNAAKCVFGF